MKNNTVLKNGLLNLIQHLDATNQENGVAETGCYFVFPCQDLQGNTRQDDKSLTKIKLDDSYSVTILAEINNKPFNLENVLKEVNSIGGGSIGNFLLFNIEVLKYLQSLQDKLSKKPFSPLGFSQIKIDLNSVKDSFNNAVALQIDSAVDNVDEQSQAANAQMGAFMQKVENAMNALGASNIKDFTTNEKFYELAEKLDENIYAILTSIYRLDNAAKSPVIEEIKALLAKKEEINKKIFELQRKHTELCEECMKKDNSLEEIKNEIKEKENSITLAQNDLAKLTLERGLVFSKKEEKKKLEEITDLRSKASDLTIQIAKLNEEFEKISPAIDEIFSPSEKKVEPVKPVGKPLPPIKDDNVNNPQPMNNHTPAPSGARQPNSKARDLFNRNKKPILCGLAFLCCASAVCYLVKSGKIKIDSELFSSLSQKLGNLIQR